MFGYSAVVTIIDDSGHLIISKMKGIQTNIILKFFFTMNDNIQLLTSDKVDLLIYQPKECNIH
jgi:hypothetical protein